VKIVLINNFEINLLETELMGNVSGGCCQSREKGPINICDNNDFT